MFVAVFGVRKDWKVQQPYTTSSVETRRELATSVSFYKGRTSVDMNAGLPELQNRRSSTNLQHLPS
jgi:hypothetical protein